MTGEERSRATAWVHEAMGRVGPAWIAAQRWFGGKSRAITAVRVEDLVWLSADAPVALCVLTIEQPAADAGGSTAERYATLLAIGEVQTPGTALDRLPGTGTVLMDATGNGAAIRALLTGLTTADSPAFTSRLAYADGGSAAAALLERPPAVDDVKTLGAEQSNTSVRIGGQHVFKLFRRLQPGPHPQIEVGRFLTRAGFRAAPALEGTVSYRTPDGDVAALAVLEAWIQNGGDGWSFVLGELERAMSAPDVEASLLADLHGLGVLTAELHDTLASEASDEAFAPEPVTESDRQEWRRQIESQAARAFELVEREHNQWPAPAGDLARQALGARDAVASWLRVFDRDTAGHGCRIRIHGDFHLGQTLKVRDGFVIIDFEGEPAKPLGERRRKQCALRDVAGMLRSLEYAAATIGRRAGARMPDPAGLRRAYLSGYDARTARGAAAFLPESPADRQAWLDAFELEKALYEVEYEINNRPAWTVIPLQAVVSLLQRSPQ